VLPEGTKNSIMGRGGSKKEKPIEQAGGKRGAKTEDSAKWNWVEKNFKAKEGWFLKPSEKR